MYENIPATIPGKNSRKDQVRLNPQGERLAEQEGLRKDQASSQTSVLPSPSGSYGTLDNSLRQNGSQFPLLRNERTEQNNL